MYVYIIPLFLFLTHLSASGYSAGQAVLPRGFPGHERRGTFLARV